MVPGAIKIFFSNNKFSIKLSAQGFFPGSFAHTNNPFEFLSYEQFNLSAIFQINSLRLLNFI